MSAPVPRRSSLAGRWLKAGITAGVAAASLYLVFAVYAAGQPLWALAVLAVLALGFFVYLSNIAFAYRYLFPGLAAMALFVAFPLVYTAQIGFTNYSSSNLLSQARASAYLLDQTEPDEARAFTFTLHADGRRWRLVLTPQADAVVATRFVSPPLALPAAGADATLQPLEGSGFQPGDALPLADVLKHRDALMASRLTLPDGSVLVYQGVREFGPLNPVWKAGADGALINQQTGVSYRPNRVTGHFESPGGERLQPGFTVGVGLANYARMVTDPDFRGPFLSIFVWTVAFSALTVLFSLIIGTTLAVLLNWESLRFRTTYRTLLFLPYAVPGFISILVFKGLFNQNFGEINAILHALFGVKPAWFANPLLAKTMLVIVNTWLGYPYIMVLCTGLLKAIPADLYEASAIAGAGPVTNFMRITAPLIVKPLTPLLISAFAFNFNNFVLIALLTNGRPDYLNTKLPAGTTDILVSYTYRIAFQDSGQNFGLAAAISTVIFFLVALLSLANLRLTKVNPSGK